MQTLIAIDIFLYSKYGVSNMCLFLYDYSKEFESLITHPHVQAAYNNYVQNQIILHQYLIDQYHTSFNGIVRLNPENSPGLVKRYELITKSHEILNKNTDHMLIEFKDRLTDNDKKTLKETVDRVLMHKYNIFYELRDKHVLECISNGVEMQHWNFYESSIVKAFNDLGISNIFKINPWLLITTHADFVIDPDFTFAQRKGFNFNLSSLDIHTSRMENWDSAKNRPLLTHLMLDGVSYKSFNGSIFTDEYNNLYPYSQVEYPVAEKVPEPVERSFWQKIMDSKIELNRSKSKVFSQLNKTTDRNLIAKYDSSSEFDFLINKSGVEQNLVVTNFLRDNLLQELDNSQQNNSIDQTRMLPPSNNS